MRSRRLDLARAAVVLIAVAVAIERFIAIDAASHSASDTLRPWMLQCVAIAVVATLTIVVLERAFARRD